MYTALMENMGDDARHGSRRYALVVPTTNSHETSSFHTDIRAIIHTSLPLLFTHGILAADDTLLAVEGCVASESRQTKLAFKSHSAHHRDRDFVMEGSRWDGNGVARLVAVIHHCSAIP